MPAESSVIETPEDMLRAFRFPRPQPRDVAFLLMGAFLLGLVLKLLSMRRGKPPPPPVGGLDANQRRAEFRVPSHFLSEYRPEGSPDWLAGTICDLSAGGVTVMTENPLPAPGRLRLNFSHGEETFEDLQVEVVRSDAAQWSRRHYLHCRFLEVPPDVDQRLRRTIAERERELLKHGRPGRRGPTASGGLPRPPS